MNNYQFIITFYCKNFQFPDYCYQIDGTELIARLLWNFTIFFGSFLLSISIELEYFLGLRPIFLLFFCEFTAHMKDAIFAAVIFYFSNSILNTAFSEFSWYQWSFFLPLSVYFEFLVWPYTPSDLESWLWAYDSSPW